MIIPQEESTPIGDYFHDSGMNTFFQKLHESVDEFDVDADNLNAYCDKIIECAKGLKAQIKKAEVVALRQKKKQELEDLMRIDL